MLTDDDVTRFIKEFADLSDENFFGDNYQMGIYDIIVNERNKRLQAVANKNLSTMRKKGGVEAK